MKLNKLLVMLLLLLGFIYSSQQEVSLVDFITKIEKKLPEIKINKLRAESVKTVELEAQSLYDINLTLNAGLEQSFAAAGDDQNNNLSGQKEEVRLSMLEYYSGARLSLRFQNESHQRPTLTSSDKPNVLLTSVQLNVPLLKNIFGKSTSFALKNAKLFSELQDLLFLQNKKNILSTYTKIFFKVLEYEKELVFLKESIEKAKSQVSQIQKKFKAGVLDDDQYQSARSLIFLYQDRFYKIQMIYQKMVLDIKPYFDFEKVKPLSSDWEKQIHIAEIQKLDVTNFEHTLQGQYMVKSQDRLNSLVDISKNEILPNLDLVGSVLATANSESFSDSMKGLKPNAYIGLGFSFPLGNHKSRAKLESSKIALQLINQEFVKNKRSYFSLLEGVITSIKYTRLLILSKKDYISSQQLKYSAEKKKYKQGRFSLSDLINTENQISNEQINLLALQNSLVNYYFDYKNIIK